MYYRGRGTFIPQARAIVPYSVHCTVDGMLRSPRSTLIALFGEQPYPALESTQYGPCISSSVCDESRNMHKLLGWLLLETSFSKAVQGKWSIKPPRAQAVDAFHKRMRTIAVLAYGQCLNVSSSQRIRPCAAGSDH